LGKLPELKELPIERQQLWRPLWQKMRQKIQLHQKEEHLCPLHESSRLLLHRSWMMRASCAIFVATAEPKLPLFSWTVKIATKFCLFALAARLVPVKKPKQQQSPQIGTVMEKMDVARTEIG
jgi:hypothetical protein